MASSILSRYFTGITPLSILATVLLIALIMMSAATQNSAFFSHSYSLLLLINVIGIIVLLILISLNIYRLFTQYKQRVLGSRLTIRVFALFVLLSVTPVLIVFLFSIQTLNKGIDSWFDVKIEQAMDDALMLGRTSFDALKQDLLQTSAEFAIELEDTPNTLVLSDLNYLREQHDIYELTLFTQDGKIISSSSQAGPETQSLLPTRPDETILSQIRQGQNYANLDPVREGELYLRVVLPVYSRDVGSPIRILQVLQQLPNRYTKLGESVQSAFVEYEKLVYLRGPLKFGFMLTLSLVALLTLLMSVTVAMFTARRLVSPIRDLAEGTEAIAQGNYSLQLPVPSHDEIGMLVKSFNEMTQKISQAQSQIKQSQIEAELQRTNLATVLAHLSSGVMSFDHQLFLNTYNSAAEQILEVSLAAGQKKRIDWIGNNYANIQTFASAIESGIQSGQDDWQKEISIQNQSGRRAITIHGTSLPEQNNRQGGYVIVFDDITDLIRAQRDAAWGEVARRLAHEIKNPLTPIQLSAERIRHKFMGKLAANEKDLLDQATLVIIEQVESLKSMVNAFSDYARPAEIRRSTIDLNRLIQDIITLHQASPSLTHLDTKIESKNDRLDTSDQINYRLDLAEDLPPLTADADRLRQILHNLILNAKDALNATPQPVIYIQTQCYEEDCHNIILSFEDNGPGFRTELIDRVFEPYVTSKDKGTGLGLAIVNKIVEEHNGNVTAHNIEGGGAKIIILLPVNSGDTIGSEPNKRSAPGQRANKRRLQ